MFKQQKVMKGWLIDSDWVSHQRELSILCDYATILNKISSIYFTCSLALTEWGGIVLN